VVRNVKFFFAGPGDHLKPPPGTVAVIIMGGVSGGYLSRGTKMEYPKADKDIMVDVTPGTACLAHKTPVKWIVNQG